MWGDWNPHRSWVFLCIVVIWTLVEIFINLEIIDAFSTNFYYIFLTGSFIHHTYYNTSYVFCKIISKWLKYPYHNPRGFFLVERGGSSVKYMNTYIYFVLNIHCTRCMLRFYPTMFLRFVWRINLRLIVGTTPNFIIVYHSLLYAFISSLDHHYTIPLSV